MFLVLPVEFAALMKVFPTLIVDKSNLLEDLLHERSCPMMPHVRHLPVLSSIEQELLASGDATRDNYTTMIWFCS